MCPQANGIAHLREDVDAGARMILVNSACPSDYMVENKRPFAEAVLPAFHKAAIGVWASPRRECYLCLRYNLPSRSLGVGWSVNHVSGRDPAWPLAGARGILHLRKAHRTF